MNLKLFHTRLDDHHAQADQEAINRFMETVTVKKLSTQFIPADPDYWSIMVFYEEGNTSTASTADAKLHVDTSDELTAEELEIVNALKQWRKDKAREANLPDFMICQNAALMALSRYKPRNVADLSKVKGFGEQKIAKYGDDIIGVLNAF